MLSKIYKARKAGRGPTLQVTIPPMWVKSLGVVESDYLIVEVQEDKLIVRPMSKGDKTE